MNKTLILVVEDDRPIRNLIVTTLKTHDYKYLAAENGFSAILEASSHNPDIVLLDLGLPDMEGVEVIKKIRTWSNMPIIVISARSEDTDKIEALDAGADDYITKPFSVEELLARIRVTQRRLAVMQSGEQIESSVFENGGLKIDYTAGCTYLKGEELHLTPIEYKLLCLLSRNVGKVLTHTYITQQIWGRCSDNDVASLRVFMATLRKKLEPEKNGVQYIHWKDENIADSITTHAIDFIKQHKDEPFFMYFATNDVHVPRFPHDRFRGKNPMGVRGDAIVQFDWSVGQIMETLDKLGLAENTLIILSSDNGPVVDDGYDDKAEELLNGHSPAGPWRGNKYSAFEGGTAVPAIVRWPKKIKENRESDVLMSQIDWMASLGALVNARLPKGSAPDSYNRIGNLLGTDDEDRPWVIELASNHVLSVRTKDWKYIEPNDGPAMIQWGPKIETGNLSTPQLYDMRKEINERANVALQHPEVVYDMQNILRRVRNKTIKME